MVNILSQQLGERRWVVIKAVDHEELGRAFPAWLGDGTASTRGGSPARCSVAGLLWSLFHK